MHEYYYRDLEKLIRFIIPEKCRILKVENEHQVIEKSKTKYDYILLNNIIGDLTDVQLTLKHLKTFCTPETRVVITYYNHLWEPILKFASAMGWRKKVKNQNWLDNQDISNLLELAGYEVITQQKRMLVPVDFTYITDVLNKWAAPLPIINSLCLTTWVIARIKPEKRTDYSVSIIVPARNEEGNIRNIVKSIPKFGKWQEVVFVEGHSKDRTWEEIKKLGDKRGRISVRAFKQSGIGKADAVRLGFSKARGELLIILDADLTVDPGDLIKFYEVISSNQGEFANGSRLIYPMEKQAMQTLNKFGNTIFSRLFTWILGQRFKDTLCGTKAILMIYYQKIVKYRNYFGDFDPFGDYDLIFGAVKQNLKVVEIPIRYRERVYGKTNISRFTHGWLLLKMTWFAFGKFKTW